MSQQLQITGGAKVRDLQDVIIGTSGVLSSLAFNVANGVPKLDVNGKILVSQLPNSVMEYKGTWDASTNTPTLVNGTGNQGDVYLCNVAGTTNFGAGPITFAVGDSAIYSGTIWQRAGGATGTVTSVGLSTSGNAFTIGSSPVTTSGTITINGSGNSGQYINGAGNLTTFPTLISSIGLTMPSAFSVANSPLTSNGTIAVTGAGVASQYIRGDGTLANFPTSGGGGSSVAYYFNSSVSQGTLGGVAYRELSKVPIIGAGTDITIATNGYIANYITDAGDPSLLEIPAGNWNFEMFFSASSGGGSPSFYVELYKYDGTTFTLISSSSATPEGITNGTAIDLYTTALAVPLTTLTLTDRLAIRVYVNNSGRTITLHTENSHLCEVITTFSTGIAALNGLTAQVQYFATGTSGTDFNISSSTATHTFNIPDASATNRGLITTGSQTIAGDKAFTGINSFDYGINYKTGASLANVSGYISQAYATSGTGAGSTLSLKISDGNSVKAINLDFVGSPATYTYTFPDFSGTVALTSQLNFLPLAGGIMTGSILLNNNLTISGQLFGTSSYASMIAMSPSDKVLIDNSGRGVNFGGTIGNGTYTYTLPSATGTLALTSDIPSLANYVTLNTIQTISANKTFSEFGFFDKGVLIKQGNYPASSGYNGIGAIGGGFYFSLGQTTVQTLYFNTTTPYNYTFPSATGTIALTSDLSTYVPYTGATGAVNLGSYKLTAASIEITGGTGTAGNLTFGQSDAFSIPSANNSSIDAITTSFSFAVTAADSSYKYFKFETTSLTNNTLRSYTLPDASGTLPLGTGTTNYHAKWTGTNTIGNSLIWDNGTNVGIGNTNTSYTLDVSGTIRGTGSAFDFYTSSGLGTSSASGLMRVITSGTSVGIAIGQSNSTRYTAIAANDYNIYNDDFFMRTNGAFPLVLGTNNTARLTISSTGNVGIGTGSPTGKLMLYQATAGNVLQNITSNQGGATQVGINLSPSMTDTEIASNPAQASIYATDSNYGANIIFSNKTTGAVGNALTERMRITSGGQIVMGRTTPSGSGRLTVDGDLYLHNISSGAGQSTLKYNYTSTGLVTFDGSSRLLKKDIENLGYGLDDVLKMSAKKYKWKRDDSIDLGFIADEMVQIIPEIVFFSTEMTNETTGVPIGEPLSINYDRLIPVLVNAIQELSGQNQDFKSRLDKAGL